MFYDKYGEEIVLKDNRGSEIKPGDLVSVAYIDKPGSRTARPRLMAGYLRIENDKQVRVSNNHRAVVFYADETNSRCLLLPCTASEM